MMTIMAEPGKISDFVVSAVLVYMVYRKHSPIGCLASFAYSWNFMSIQNTSVRILAGCVIWMLRSVKMSVPPLCLTRFRAEILSAF
jgi:hypothetical protein